MPLDSSAADLVFYRSTTTETFEARLGFVSKFLNCAPELDVFFSFFHVLLDIAPPPPPVHQVLEAQAEVARWQVQTQAQQAASLTFELDDARHRYAQLLQEHQLLHAAFEAAAEAAAGGGKRGSPGHGGPGGSPGGSPGSGGLGSGGSGVSPSSGYGRSRSPRGGGGGTSAAGAAGAGAAAAADDGLRGAVSPAASTPSAGTLRGLSVADEARVAAIKQRAASQLYAAATRAEARIEGALRAASPQLGTTATKSFIR
jgi:hypothetical protein